MKRVALLFGGASSEHEVSLVSAANVYEMMKQTGDYEIVPIGIDRKGRFWRLFTAPTAACLDEESSVERQALFFKPDFTAPGFYEETETGLHYVPLDLAFPVLHGRNGEDGRLQGLLLMLGLPLVGCQVLDSALCMDKAVSRQIFDQAGIPQATWTYLREELYRLDEAAALAQIEEKISYPIFVKPANAGSSVGISKAHDRSELSQGIELALRFDRKVVLEESIQGREIELAVLRDPAEAELVVSPPGEIRPAAEFYDYQAKYADARSELLLPAPLEKETVLRLQSLARKAFAVVDGHGLSRIDFFLTADGRIYLNEINTLPGFTAISMYPKLMALAAYDAKRLMAALIRDAEETYRIDYQKTCARS